MFAWISGVWRKSKALFHRLTQDVQRANLRSRTGDPTWVLTEWLLKCWLWLSRGEKKFWHTLYTAPQMAKANMSICSTNLMVFFFVCERTSTRTKGTSINDVVGLCFLTSLFAPHGRWWFLTYLKPSGGVSSPLSYKLLYTAGVSSPSHEKPLVLGEITLLMEVSRRSL